MLVGDVCICVIAVLGDVDTEEFCKNAAVRLLARAVTQKRETWAERGGSRKPGNEKYNRKKNV